MTIQMNVDGRPSSTNSPPRGGRLVHQQQQQQQPQQQNALNSTAHRYETLKYKSPVQVQAIPSMPIPMPFDAMQYGQQAIVVPNPPVNSAHNSSVFYVDSKGSDRQSLPMIYGGQDLYPPMQAMVMPMQAQSMPMEMAMPQQFMAPQSRMQQFIPYNEHDILKDIEMDSMLYGVGSPTLRAMAVDRANNDDDDQIDNEDLTIKLKQETNLFNPDLVHTQIVHPPEDSPERAHQLFDRAFMPRSPEFDRLSHHLQQMDYVNNNSMSPPGFGMAYRRNSQNLFTPFDDEQRISDMHLRQPPPYIQGMTDEQKILASGGYRNIHGDLIQVSRMSGSSGGGMDHMMARRIRACQRCHKAKKKCVRPPIGGDCYSCMKKDVACVFRPDGRAQNKGNKARRAKKNAQELKKKEEEEKVAKKK